MSYKAFFRSKLTPPLQGPYGTGWANGIMQFVDDAGVDLRAAGKRGMPSVTGAEGDDLALAYLGTERGMPRYPSETSAEYGERLRQAWTLYERSGGYRAGVGAIETELEGLGWGGVEVVEYIDWPETGPPPNAHASPLPIVDANGDPWWSRFWVYADSYDGADIVSAPPWGTFVWGTDPWGTDVGSDAIASAIRAILKRKPAHALAVSLVLLLDGSTMADVWGSGLWGTMTWGSAGGAGSSLFIPIMK